MKKAETQLSIKRVLARFWREWARPMLIILGVTCALRSALADWNDVPTPSMEPTILVGDRVFVNKLAYDLKVPFTMRHLAEWGEPQRGDIVVFFSPHDGTRLVKRVVGLPGDTIALRRNQLFINGEPVRCEVIPADQGEWALPEAGMRVRTAEEQLGRRRHRLQFQPAIPSRNSMEPLTVPPGQYFMMGDNRDNSFDSRFFGCVDRRRIIGRATAVAMSFDRQHWYRPRWQRFFSALD